MVYTFFSYPDRSPIVFYENTYALMILDDIKNSRNIGTMILKFLRSCDKNMDWLISGMEIAFRNPIESPTGFEDLCTLAVEKFNS